MGCGVRQFGRQTITFVSVGRDVTNLDRYGKPAQVTTPTDVPGCRFRPVSSTETINDNDKVTDVWRATCPPVGAVLAAKTTDHVVVNGVTYQIDGNVELFTDLAGNPFKATVVVKRVTG